MPIKNRKYIVLRNDLYMKSNVYAMALSGYKVEIVKKINGFCQTLDRMESRGR